MKTIKIIFFILITVIISANLSYPIIYGSVSGVVTDEETGKGLPGVRVNLFGRINLYSETNKDGKFAAKLLKPGKYEISFTPPFPYCCLTRGNFVIEPGVKIIFNGVAKLAGTIRGKVLYSDTKKPFPGVTITAFGRFSGWAEQKTVEDGSYFLGVDNGKLCPSPNYYIKADCNIPNFAYKVLLGIVVEKGKETKVEDILFDLNDTGIEGWIKSSIDGKPLNKIQVSVFSSVKNYPGENEPVEYGDVYTNNEGYYSGHSFFKYFIKWRKMNHKISLTLLFFFFILVYFYSHAAEEVQWGGCNWSFKTRKRIEKWLNNSMKEVKKTVNEGREYNGENHKLEKCKIDEINNLFNKLKFEYNCTCGGCGSGGTSHPYAPGIPYIRICQPFDMYINSSKNKLDDPPETICGCIQGLILHELVHAAGEPTEAGAVDCSKILYPCALDPFKDESPNHENCKCCEKKGA